MGCTLLTYFTSLIYITPSLLPSSCTEETCVLLWERWHLYYHICAFYRISLTAITRVIQNSFSQNLHYHVVATMLHMRPCDWKKKFKKTLFVSNSIYVDSVWDILLIINPSIKPFIHLFHILKYIFGSRPPKITDLQRICQLIQERDHRINELQYEREWGCYWMVRLSMCLNYTWG